MSSVHLFCCWAWSLYAEDVCCLKVSDHRCSSNIGRFKWRDVLHMVNANPSSCAVLRPSHGMEDINWKSDGMHSGMLTEATNFNHVSVVLIKEIRLLGGWRH